MVVVFSVTAPVAVNAVNVPAADVVAPIVMLLIVPSVAGPMVTTPVPVGCNSTFALAGLNVTVLDAVSVVNDPVEPLIPILLIEPVVPDEMVIVPAPVVV